MFTHDQNTSHTQLLLDSTFQSNILQEKYNQERKFLILSSEYPIFAQLTDDFVLFFSFIRIYCQSKYPHPSLTIPDQWKKSRQLALSISKNGYLAHYYRKNADLEPFLQDREIMKNELSKSWATLPNIKFELGSDRKFMMEVCQLNGKALSYASKELKQDKELVLNAIRHGGEEAYRYCDESLKKDFDIVFEAIKHYKYVKLNKKMLTDRIFILKLMEYNPDIFFSIKNDAIRMDPVVLKLAIQKKIEVLRLAPPALQKDREFVLECVKNSGEEFEFAHYTLRKDRELALQAVKQHGAALQFCENFNQTDRELVLQAVKNYGSAIQFTSDPFKNDFEIAFAAVQNDPTTFELLDLSLQLDKRILKEYLTNSSSHTCTVSDLLCSQPFYDIISQDPELYYFAVVNIENYLKEPLPEFVNADYFLNLLRNGFKQHIVPDVPEKFKNEQILLEMIKRNVFYITKIGQPLILDRDFILKCVKTNVGVFTYIPNDFKKDKEIVLIAARNGLSFSEIDSSFHSDRDILKEYVFTSYWNIGDLKVLNDPEFIVECVKIGLGKTYSLNNFLRLRKNVILSNESLFVRVVKIYPTLVGEFMNIDRHLIELAFKSL